MKHLKLNETEIKRSFTEWLKDPKKPVQDEKTTYYFRCPAIKYYRLIDNGRFTNDEILNYIKSEHDPDIWNDLSQFSDESVSDLKKDPELLYKVFSEYFMDIFGDSRSWWDEFIREYMTKEDELNNKDIDELNKLLKVVEPFDHDLAWFRVIDTIIIDNNWDSVKFRITTSRKLRDDEEVNFIIEYIENTMSQIEAMINQRKIKYYDVKRFEVPEGGNLKFSIDIFLTEQEFIDSVRDWKIKLIK